MFQTPTALLPNPGPDPVDGSSAGGRVAAQLGCCDGGGQDRHQRREGEKHQDHHPGALLIEPAGCIHRVLRLPIQMGSKPSRLCPGVCPPVAALQRTISAYLLYMPALPPAARMLRHQPRSCAVLRVVHSDSTRPQRSGRLRPSFQGIPADTAGPQQEHRRRAGGTGSDRGHRCHYRGRC